MSTLLTLPLDLGILLSAFLDDRSIARLQSVCKATRRWTESRLLALSNTLPNTEEVLAYLRDQMTRATPTQMTLLGHGDQPNTLHTTLELRREQYYFTRVQDPEDITEEVHTETLVVSEDRLRSLLELRLVDPTTLLMVLQRRLGPMRAHLRAAGPYDRYTYGMALARAYARDVLRPLLEPLVGSTELANTLLGGGKGSLSVPLLPLPRPELDRRVERFSDAVNGWIYQHRYERRIRGTDGEEEIAATYEMTRESVAVGDVLSSDLLRRKHLRMEPTTSQVLDYIHLRLQEGKPVRMAFYAEVGCTPMTEQIMGPVDDPGCLCRKCDPLRDEVTTRVYLLDMEDAGCGTFVEYVAGFSTTRVRVSSGPEILRRLTRERRLPGVVDPVSARCVSQWVCQRRALSVLEDECRVKDSVMTPGSDLYVLRKKVVEDTAEKEWSSYSWESWITPTLDYLNEHLGTSLKYKDMWNISPSSVDIVGRGFVGMNVYWKMALYATWCTRDAETWYSSTSKIEGEDEEMALRLRCLTGILSTYKRILTH